MHSIERKEGMMAGIGTSSPDELKVLGGGEKTSLKGGRSNLFLGGLEVEGTSIKSLPEVRSEGKLAKGRSERGMSLIESYGMKSQGMAALACYGWAEGPKAAKEGDAREMTENCGASLPKKTVPVKGREIHQGHHNKRSKPLVRREMK